MTVELQFEGRCPASSVSDALISDNSVSIDVSSETGNIGRHDIIIEKSGGQIFVRLKGVSVSELSDSTEQSIISQVPTNHINTVGV